LLLDITSCESMLSVEIPAWICTSFMVILF
jgi:hypothetical protein